MQHLIRTRSFGSHRSQRCPRSTPRSMLRAELALDEAHARDPHPLLLVRRTRVALAEWLTRAARGEIDERTIDVSDEQELSRAAMWFPTVQLPGSLRAARTDNIQRLRGISYVQA